MPLVKPIQRVVIRTEVFGKSGAPDRLPEHPTKCHTIDDAGLNSKTDDPSGELIHDYEDPIRAQCNGFATDQINAPQTVLHVANEG